MALFKDHLYSMNAYEPPLEGRSASEHLLLDFNERTLPVSDGIVSALCEYVNSGNLQKYPAYGDILDRLATYTGVDANRLMITNGSDQGIDLVIRAALYSKSKAIIPEPSFAMYRQVAEVENAEIVAPRYSIEAGYPVAEVIDALTENTRLVVIPLPNNPTGTVVSVEDVERILKAAPNTLVLVDECYFEYSGVTVADLLDDYDNLVITRTFSKTWGMPSLRFGFLMSQSDNIEQLLKIRGPYDVNQLAIVAAGKALSDPDYTTQYVREVMTESKPLVEEWLGSRGISFWPSRANFLWAFPPEPELLLGHLKKNGILVRPKLNHEGQLGLRITLGNRAQTEQLLGVLKEFCEVSNDL